MTDRETCVASFTTSTVAFSTTRLEGSYTTPEIAPVPGVWPMAVLASRRKNIAATARCCRRKPAFIPLTLNVFLNKLCSIARSVREIERPICHQLVIPSYQSSLQEKDGLHSSRTNRITLRLNQTAASGTEKTMEGKIKMARLQAWWKGWCSQVAYAKRASRSGQPGKHQTSGLADPQILVAFCWAARAHLPRTSNETSQFGTLVMNTFALLRNALWTACLSVAFIVLFSCGRSANAQSSSGNFSGRKRYRPPRRFQSLLYRRLQRRWEAGSGLYLTTSNAPSSVGIQLNFGSSAPTTVTTPLCVAGAGQPSFADVNNDKKLDLVYSCNGFLTIQLGNGDGTFQPPAYFGQYSTTTPVFADLNGDGYLDIAALIPIANAPPQVAVFLNQGATAPGVFATPTLYAAPSGATGLSGGDFNGDGKQDLVTAILPTGVDIQFAFNAFSDSLRQWGRHAERAKDTIGKLPFTASRLATLMVMALRILPCCWRPQLMAFLLRCRFCWGATVKASARARRYPVAATPLPGGLPLPMAAVALTNDGNLDLVVYANVMNVFHGDGKGGFTPTGTYAVSAPANGAPGGAGYLFADVNGDGNQDLIVPSPAPGVLILLGNGGSTFQAQPGTPVSGPVADVNNDGIADMVFLRLREGTTLARHSAEEMVASRS